MTAVDAPHVRRATSSDLPRSGDASRTRLTDAASDLRLAGDASDLRPADGTRHCSY
jgi:hypothetical protein